MVVGSVRARGMRVVAVALAGAFFGLACGGAEEAPPKAPDTAQVPSEPAQVPGEPAQVPGEPAQAPSEPAQAPEPEPAAPAAVEPEASPAALDAPATKAAKPSVAKPAKPPKATAAAEAPATAAYDGPEPCEGKSFSVPAVREACAKGGRAKAKLVMKQAITNARAAGTSLKCSDCHVDQKGFKLKPDAVKELKRWLES